MKIGLVDVDGLGKKVRRNGNVYPNLALCKLARWHKMQGDDVEWALPFFHYNRIYMSKIFSFSPDDLTAYQADKIIKGGTGYNITSQLPDEIDRLQPDYSIYPTIPSDTAYGFLTRGCPNNCPWCVVPRKEGKIRPYMDVDEIAIEGRTKLVLMDNNILAAGDYAIEQLTKIIMRGYRVDFNQALDARLLTPHLAHLLAKVKWINRRIRFGCDTQAQIKYCERAIAMLNRFGFKGDYYLYTMIGGKSDFNESYERVNYWRLRNLQFREQHQNNVYPYAQPYRDPDNPHQVIPQWQKDMAGWCNKQNIFWVTDFYNFTPRKGFRCAEYFRSSYTNY